MIEPMDSQDGYEQEIDRVLAALNRVEPGTGMEARVLRRLEERAETKASSPWMWRMGWGGAVAAAVVAIAFAMLHSGRRAAPHDHGVVAHAVTPVAVTPSRSGMVASASIAEVKERPLAERGQRERTERNPLPIVRAPEAAETDAKAASFPAPPLPLTEQERLLVRVAHRGEEGPVTPPPSIANGTEIAEVRAESDKFFQDPTTGENQWKRIVAEQAPAK